MKLVDLGLKSQHFTQIFYGYKFELRLVVNISK